MKFPSFGKKKAAATKEAIIGAESMVITVDLKAPKGKGLSDSARSAVAEEVKAKVKQLQFANPIHQALMKELAKKGLSDGKAPGDEQLDIDLESVASAEAVAGTVVGASGELEAAMVALGEEEDDEKKRVKAIFGEGLAELSSVYEAKRRDLDTEYQRAADKLRQQLDKALLENKNAVDESDPASSKCNFFGSVVHGLKSLIPFGRSRTYETKEAGGSSEVVEEGAQ